MASNYSSAIAEIVLYADDTSTDKTDYNCLVSMDLADTYHGRRLNNVTWRTADEDTRTSALFWATDILSRQSWVGQPTDFTQALAWPRRLVSNLHVATKIGAYGESLGYGLDDPNYGVAGSAGSIMDHTLVPKFIEDATAELALYLILRSGSGKAETYSHDENISSLSVGGISINFKEEESVITNIPSQVYHMISDFLFKVKELDPSVVSAYSVRLGRG